MADQKTLSSPFGPRIPSSPRSRSTLVPASPSGSSLNFSPPSPSGSSLSPSTPGVNATPILTDTIEKALKARPLNLASKPNPRRDLTTSIKVFKAAWEILPKTEIFSNQCYRLCERGARVLLDVKDKLEALRFDGEALAEDDINEDWDGVEGLGKASRKGTYEFKGRAGPDNVFKLQGILFDLQLFITAIAGDKDKLALLISSYEKTMSSIEDINAKLESCVHFYELPQEAYDLPSWPTQNEEDVSADLSNLPRLLAKFKGSSYVLSNEFDKGYKAMNPSSYPVRLNGVTPPATPPPSSSSSHIKRSASYASSFTSPSPVPTPPISPSPSSFLSNSTLNPGTPTTVGGGPTRPQIFIEWCLRQNPSLRSSPQSEFEESMNVPPLPSPTLLAPSGSGGIKLPKRSQTLGGQRALEVDKEFESGKRKVGPAGMSRSVSGSSLLANNNGNGAGAGSGVSKKSGFGGDDETAVPSFPKDLMKDIRANVGIGKVKASGVGGGGRSVTLGGAIPGDSAKLVKEEDTTSAIRISTSPLVDEPVDVEEPKETESDQSKQEPSEKDRVPDAEGLATSSSSKEERRSAEDVTSSTNSARTTVESVPTSPITPTTPATPVSPSKASGIEAITELLFSPEPPPPPPVPEVVQEEEAQASSPTVAIQKDATLPSSPTSPVREQVKAPQGGDEMEELQEEPAPSNGKGETLPPPPPPVELPPPPPPQPRPLRVLSLDGGGVRGLSSLLLLRQIMSLVQRQLGLPRPPAPYKYFDLICGSGTGGLIALLLGRLHLDVDSAMRLYVEVARGVFGREKGVLSIILGKDSRFSAKKLESGMKEAVMKVFKDDGAIMKDDDLERVWSRLEEGVGGEDGDVEEGCRTFVLAVHQRSGGEALPRRIRTYDSISARDYSSTSFPIWQAARATSAAPTFFKPIDVTLESSGQEQAPAAAAAGGRMTFMDSSSRYNNPSEQALEEVQEVWGSSVTSSSSISSTSKSDGKRKIGCFISIGTGRQRRGKSRVAKACAEISSSCEEADLRVENQFRKAAVQAKGGRRGTVNGLYSPGANVNRNGNGMEGGGAGQQDQIFPSYFRFNVDEGLEDGGLEEWDKSGLVEECAKRYWNKGSVADSMDDCVELLAKLSSQSGWARPVIAGGAGRNRQPYASSTLPPSPNSPNNQPPLRPSMSLDNLANQRYQLSLGNFPSTASLQLKE